MTIEQPPVEGFVLTKEQLRLAFNGRGPHELNMLNLIETMFGLNSSNADSLTEVEETTYRDGVNQILVSRYAKGGPIAPALYVLVNAEPTHDLKRRSKDGKWWEIAEPILYPGYAGAVKGTTFQTEELNRLNVAATVLKRPIRFDGVYSRDTQWFIALPLDVGGSTIDARLIVKYGSNSAPCLVQSSDVTFHKGLTVELQYPDGYAGPYGTVFTVGQYVTANPLPILTNVNIDCTTVRPANSPANSITFLGNVDNSRCHATIYGGGGAFNTGFGFIAHWGCQGTALDAITGYTYHPRNLDIDVKVYNAGTACGLSSVFNVKARVQSVNCPAVLGIFPGDNGNTYAEPSQKDFVGSGIEVRIHGIGADPNKAVYMTGVGDSPFDDEYHSVVFKDLDVSGYVRLGTPSTTQQVIDIENIIGAGTARVAIELENAGAGLGFALERAVGIDFSGCSSDADTGYVAVRSRDIRWLGCDAKQPRQTSIRTTHGIRIYGERLARTLATDVAPGTTLINLTAAAGQRLLPGDPIEITDGASRVRTVYVAKPCKSTSTLIHIRPADFTASTGAAVAIRLDLANMVIEGGNISGYRYGITANNDVSSMGATFRIEGLCINGVLFTEIGERNLHMFQYEQGSVTNLRDRDCGTHKLINAALNTRAGDFSSCKNVIVHSNMVNVDSSPNMTYGYVHNAACVRLDFRFNRFGAMAGAVDTGAFLASDTTDNSYADNYYLSGTAATP